MATYKEYYKEAVSFLAYGNQFLKDAKSFHGVDIHVYGKLLMLAKHCLKKAESKAEVVLGSEELMVTLGAEGLLELIQEKLSEVTELLG